MPDQKNNPTNTSNPAPAAPLKGSNTKLVIIIVIIGAVLVVLGGGVYFANRFFTEEAAETTIEKATGGKVDIQDEGEKVSIETDEGKLTIGQDKVPSGFPSDITVYSGSEIAATAETDTDVSLQLKTPDSVSKVFEFYKDDLASNGWTQTSTASYQDSAIISAEKSGKQVIITVAVSEEDNKTLISIMVGKPTN
ncbi:MAG TPA: hypothetical protein VF303_04130 [Candidatus Nanoarchaeia archaeon]